MRVLLAVVFFLVWTGSALLLDAWLTRPRKQSLEDRLRPFQPTIADEVELWLSREP